jgi:YD repeat-containing protein
MPRGPGLGHPPDHAAHHHLSLPGLGAGCAEPGPQWRARQLDGPALCCSCCPAAHHGAVIPLAYDPKAQTLSGQSTVLGPGPLVIGGPTANQSPPIPILASVLGNNGQLGLSYPITLPPNARGFLPHLSLSYSSADTNQRTTITSPADLVGDGWSLGLGSITAAEYPGGSAASGTWYFLSGAGNISDRLVPDPEAGFYQTEHVSRLRLQQITSGSTGQICFQAYDTSGTFYEFGCTSDALQYWTDQSSHQRHNYRWDLDKIISPNEGPSAQREYIYFSYLQDCSPCTTDPTIRASAIQQIVYGQHLPDKTQETIAGTIDFSYHAPYNQSPWVTKYPSNYNCFQTPPDGQSTIYRCDDPIDRGSANGDSATYTYGEVIDPNNHVAVGFTDALGRTRYVQQYSGLGLSSLSSNIVQQKSIQYNALNEPISVVTTDLAPQPGQSTTSVIASYTYDDLGRVTAMGDPDRGTHSYSYDGDGHLLSDVSGTRTIGTNYDLLGRVGCIQDAAPVINATGACTNGTHPYVQNTYDTTFLGTRGTTDFPVGRLTQSVATTYYPDSTSATVTQQVQHDQRGRSITGTMQLTWPGSWGVTTPLPSYQIVSSYNDADQPTTTTTTTTSTNPPGQGYTTTNVYDSTTGALVGLSNTGNATANVALLTFTPRAQINTITDYTTTGTGLSSEQYSYDANLRATGATATWLSGSGSSGTILSQSKTYDPASNVTSLSTTLAAVPGASGSGGSETQNYCYNEQNRLVWAGNSGSQPGAGNGTCGSGTLTNSLTGAGYSASYIYTHLGQVWQAPQSTSSTNSQYLYCDSSHPHQLAGLYSLGATCSNKSGQTYASSYDAWGNVTSRRSMARQPPSPMMGSIT